MPDIVTDIVESKGDGNNFEKHQKKKSKKKRKHDSISNQSSVDFYSNAGFDNGKKDSDILVEINVPVEKNKSKKKCKDGKNACFEHDVQCEGKKKKVKSAVEKKKCKKKSKETKVDKKNEAFIGSEVEHADERNKEKDVSVESDPIERKKSKKKHKDGSLICQQEKMIDAELMENALSERKKSKKKHKDGSTARQDKSVDGERNARSDDGVDHTYKGNKRKATLTDSDPVERKKSKNKHKGATIQSPVVDETNACSDKEIKHANKSEKKKTKVAGNAASDATPNKSKKKVRFSGKDDVFILPADSNVGSAEEDNLVQGKRFTKEEDEILKQAVYHYIAKHNLGEEEGLDMVLNSKKHKVFRGCWREIGLQIPYRPYKACYCRAQVLFRRSKTRKWTQEEYDMILKHQAERGNQWKDIADELGKHRWHVKDTWRRIQMRNAKKGHWSQQEYQKLFDLVNKDLQAKVFEEKHSKHGMLRDNIPWTAISEEVSTRTQASCCMKWYDQLTSRMVVEGVWADVDDYVLIRELYSLDANCIEDVDWDNVLEDRSGDLCRKRWNQMVLHIGHHGNKSFSEQVEILAQRYCPHLLEAREAWDHKPRVS